jgi:hypothetical protein
MGRSLPVVGQPPSYRKLRQVGLNTILINSIKLGSRGDSRCGRFGGRRLGCLIGLSSR